MSKFNTRLANTTRLLDVLVTSALADTRADLRTALAANFTLRADNAAGRAEVAAVVAAAWKSSHQSYEEEIKLRQEAKGLELTEVLASHRSFCNVESCGTIKRGGYDRARTTIIRVHRPAARGD